MAGVGTRVSEFFSFSQRLQIYKKEKIFFFFWGGGDCGGRWMDSLSGPKQFAPSTSSTLGA